MIIFLHGPDSFRLKEKLKQLKARFIAEVDRSGLNLSELNGEKMSINDLNKAVGTRSFLAAKRLVVIVDLFRARKTLQSEALAFFKEKDWRDKQADTLVIVTDEKPDKRAGLYKYLNGAKFKEEFALLDPGGIAKWIQGRVSAGGGQISAGEANWLASKSDGNLWALSGEVDKLLALKKGAAITRADIEESYLSKSEENIFKLSDAIAVKDKRRALSLIEEQLAAGAGGIYLLTMIARQFRILSLVRSEMESGSSSQALAGKLRLHPFVAQKALAQVGKYELTDLKLIYSRLLEADIRLKRGMDEKVVLTKLVMDI